MLIPVDFSLQVLPGTFEYALSHIVDKHLDLTPFDDWYNNDKGGAKIIQIILDTQSKFCKSFSSRN